LIVQYQAQHEQLAAQIEKDMSEKCRQDLTACEPDLKYLRVESNIDCHNNHDFINESSCITWRMQNQVNLDRAILACRKRTTTCLSENPSQTAE